MKALIEDLFGVYDPITYTTYFEASDGTVSSVDVVPAGLAGCDLTWIAGVLLFGVTLYCVLRIIGSLIKNA